MFYTLSDTKNCVLYQKIAVIITFFNNQKRLKSFMIPGVTLPAQQLEQLLKTVSRVALCQSSQQLNHRFIAPGIALVRDDAK